MEGKRILITGGSAGLGAAIVRSINLVGRAATTGAGRPHGGPLPYLLAASADAHAICLYPLQASKLASLGAVCAINYASNESQATDLIRKLQNDRSNDAAAKHVLIKGSVFAESTAKAVVQVSARQCGDGRLCCHYGFLMMIFCFPAFQEAIEVLGGLDGVVSNAGWTKFADFRDLGRSSIVHLPDTGASVC